jgi:hypothetical protein
VVGNSADIQKMLTLNQKIKDKTATKIEKDEYMKLLFQNGSVTKKQYNDYLQGRNTEDILEAGLIIGGIFLLGYALSKLIK